MAAGPWDGLRHQVFLGGEDFVRRFHDGLAGNGTLRKILLAERPPAARSLAEYQAGARHPGEAMARASLRVYVNEIKINEGSFEPEHLDMLVLRLRTGLTAFAGREKAQLLIGEILRLKSG